MIDESTGHGRKDQQYVPTAGNIHQKDPGGLAHETMDQYGNDVLDSSSNDTSQKGENNPRKSGSQNAPPRDILVSSSASNGNKLPIPNLEGTVGSVPLEQVHPDDFKYAPPRKPNKYDTSMKSPGKIDKLNKDKIKKAIESDSSETLFPWTSIAYFSPSGKGSATGTDVRPIKAYILETFYNDWYYNVAIIAGTCFGSWLFAYCGFSWWSLSFIFFCSGSVFASEFRRFTRSTRDDLKRITVEETLSERTETTLWLNSFLSKFWVIYMPILSQQVKDVANPTLAGVAPGYGIDALSLDEFTLGSKAPSIKGIKSNTKAGKDVVEMIWTFAFTPNDVSDMTQREAKQKINPKVVLGVTLGKSFVSKTLPVIVEDINVSGRMRVVIKFAEAFPNIKIVSVQLLEPPLIEFALKPIGGDTLGLDVMSFLPGLKTFVKTMINSNVGPMLYAPHHLDIDVEEIMAAQANEAAGVLAITIASAEGLQSSGFITNTVDPYIHFKTEKPSPGAQSDMLTSIKSDTKNPFWNETKYILVNDLNQKLMLSCYDFNDVRKDTLIGNVEVNLKDLLQTPVMDDMTSIVKHGSHSKGTLHYSMHWFPVNNEKDENEYEENEKEKEKEKPKNKDDEEQDEKKDKNLDFEKLHDEDELNDEEDESDAGIVKLTLHKVKYLIDKDSTVGVLSPSAALFVDGKEVKKFRTLKRINEPSWGETVEVFVPSKSESEIKLEVYDEHLKGSTPISTYSASLETALDSLQFNQKFVEGSPRGELYMNAGWKPVRMTGVFAAISAARQTIGSLRVHIRDLNVLDDLSGIGDIDPYFTIAINGRVDYKSSHFSDNTHPTYDKVLYLPITSPKQNVSINFFDYQSVGKDRPIGVAHLPVSSVVEKDPKTDKYRYVDKSTEVNRLALRTFKNKASQNYVNISLSFVPIIPVYSPEEGAAVKEKEKKLIEKKKEFEKTQAERKKEMEKNPARYEVLEIEDPFDEEEQNLHKKETLSLEQLVQHNSGVLSLQIFRGRLLRSQTYLLIYVDDIPYPRYISSRSRDGKLLDASPVVFIRDLRHSKITLRVSERHLPKEPSNIISESTFDTYKLLQDSYGCAAKLTFGGSSMEVSCLYAPTSVNIPDVDSVLDTGYLNLKVISAENLLAKDRNGFSDPFFHIFVDGREIHKSKIIKKTLSPLWNESIKVPEPSRSRNKIEVRLFDWDRTGHNDNLGAVFLDLSSMKPNETYNWELPLDTQGTLKVQATFNEQYIKPAVNANAIKKNGQVSAALGTITNAGIGTVTGGAAEAAHMGVELATGSLDKGARLLKKPFNRLESSKKKKTSSSPSPETENSKPNERSSTDRKSISFSQAKASLEIDRSIPNNEYATVQNLDPNSQLPINESNEIHSDDLNGASGAGNSLHKRTVSSASSFARTLAPNGTYRGTVTVVATEKLGKNVQVRVSLAQGGRLKHLYRTRTQKTDEKGVARFDESCTFKASPEANLVFTAVSHHKLTKDKEIGIAQITLNDPQIQPGEQIAIKLADGHVLFKLDYGNDSNTSTPPVPPIPENYRS